jgi:hypothetical protein
MKAARWTAANASAAGDARADAAQAEGWDASVTALAADFPSVVERMADEIDWTETLGDAVIAQTDAVMDAVQRQRARAAALGNLESNAARKVTLEKNAISVTPADPEMVNVPAYDPALAYTQPATAAPLVATDPADEGYSSGDSLATGVIAFGAGMLVNELFDDDWGGGCWYGPPRFDWNDRGFYPRPGVDTGGDVNINIDRERIDRDRDRGERFRPDDDRVAGARDRISQREGGGALRDEVAAQGGADRAAGAGAGRDPPGRRRAGGRGGRPHARASASGTVRIRNRRRRARRARDPRCGGRRSRTAGRRRRRTGARRRARRGSR